MTALDRLVERRGRAGAARQFARWRATDLIDQTIDRSDGRRISSAGQWLLNFASCDYLGLAQDPRIAAACCAGARRGVSLGLPRALGSDPLIDQIETRIARLVGQERALVFPATLHAASDVLPLLAGPRGVIFIDERAYPISLAACQTAQRSGAKLHVFTHNDPRALQRLLTAFIDVRDKVIICDGVYVSGGIVRLDSFVRLAQEHDAVVYVDDAHGIGVLCSRLGALPLGHGGAGSPAFCGVRAGNHVHVGGLSKAFGVPVAFVAGPERFTDHLRLTASTFVHSSPPATPILAAALTALQVHDREGDDLRRHLVSLVRRFRKGLRGVGLELEPASLLPIQSLRLPSGVMATIAASTLRHQGIWPVLQLAPPEQPGGGAIRFVLTALHETADIDEAVAAISRTWLSVHERANLSNPSAGAFIASA